MASPLGTCHTALSGRGQRGSSRLVLIEWTPYSYSHVQSCTPAGPRSSSKSGVDGEGCRATPYSVPVRLLLLSSSITPHTRKKGWVVGPCIPLPLLQPVWQASIAIDRHNSPMADPIAWLPGRVCIRHCTGRVSQSRYSRQPGSSSRLPALCSFHQPPHHLVVARAAPSRSPRVRHQKVQEIS